MTETVVGVALGVAAVPVVAAASYLLALTLLSRRAPAPTPPVPALRFDLVVPAHQEEAGIAATVASLAAVDYPPALRRVIVVADNCSDATAARARAAGATVLVREDPTRHGKGYALHHAFAWCIADGFADAIVVVDADTIVGPGLLHAYGARLASGAAAIQADNGVANPRDSWRTCLMAIAFVLVDTVRMLGRERLGCSAGLRGNGMCFAVSLLRAVPHEAFSVVEDVEYGIRLGRAGYRVHYAHEAKVRSVMVTDRAASGVQRRRWEAGRAAIARRFAPALLRDGIARRSRVLLDLGLDLLVPPLATVGAGAVAGAVASALPVAWGAQPFPALWAFLGSLGAVAAYVLRGWWLSGTGLAGLMALLHAPAYLAWKLGLMVRERVGGQRSWARTPREPSTAPRSEAERPQGHAGTEAERRRPPQREANGSR